MDGTTVIIIFMLTITLILAVVMRYTSRVRHFANDVLDYLKLPSLDGRPVRQEKREELRRQAEELQ